MSIIVWPSENIIGSFQGRTTDAVAELQLTKWILEGGKSRLRSFVTSGFGLTAPGGAVVNVAAGVAYVGGSRIESTAAIPVTITTNGLTFLYLKVTRNAAGCITAASVIQNQVGEDVDDAACVGLVAMTAGTVTAVTAAIMNPGVNYLTYTGDGSGARNLFAGFTVRMTMIYGWNNAVSGHQVFSISSPVAMPGVVANGIGFDVPYGWPYGTIYIEDDVIKVPKVGRQVAGLSSYYVRVNTWFNVNGINYLALMMA